jgi:hypothetical protein
MVQQRAVEWQIDRNNIWRRILIMRLCRIWGYEEFCFVVRRKSYLFHAGFLRALLWNPEEGGDIFLGNVGWLSPDYTALYLNLHRENLRSNKVGFVAMFQAFSDVINLFVKERYILTPKGVRRRVTKYKEPIRPMMWTLGFETFC